MNKFAEVVASEKPSRETWIPVDATCLNCGYALLHLPQPRCPECGRAFDSNDPFSFRTRFRPRSASWLQRQIEAFWEQLRAPATRRERVEARVVLTLAFLAVIGALPRVPWEWKFLMWPALTGVIVSAMARGWGRWARGAGSDPKPIAGRWAWQAWALLVLALVVPPSATTMFWLQRPLFEAVAKEVESTLLGERFRGRYIGTTWVEIDRCPHGTFFQFPQNGNPIREYVTLFHSTDPASCSFARGVAVGDEWRFWYGWGRRRPGSY